jgi:CMP-N-acetylneuraminic acid synthetase
MNIVAIIPARGGSKGIPKKNIKLINGKPLIAYAIKAAKNCSLVSRVILSTDDEEIAKVGKEWGAEVPFMRPADLAADNARPEPVLKGVVEWLQEKENYKTDIVVYLQPTDLFRPKGIVCQVVQKLLDNPKLDSVFAAVSTHKNFWRKKEGNFERLASDIPYGVSRWIREPLYREDTGIALATKADVIKKERRIGENVDVIVSKLEFSFIDIHDEMDLWLAETVIQKLKETDELKNYEIF